MATFTDRYKQRGLMDALMGIEMDDSAQPQMGDINNLEGLLSHLNRPTNDDRREAFYQGLQAMGGQRTFADSLRAASDAVRGRMKEGKETRLGDIQTQAALKKLLIPKFTAPTTRNISEVRGGRNYTINQEFDENTGQWRNIGEKEERDFDAPRYINEFDRRMNELKMQQLENKIAGQGQTPEQAGLEQFRKAEAIKKAESAAAMPAMIGLMDQAEATVKSYLPEVKVGGQYVKNPDFDAAAYNEIMSEGGAGQYIPKVFKSGTAAAAGKARMDQLEAFGKTLSGADFAQLFKPMSNADIQMIGSLASIMADPSISDTSRTDAMRIFYEEYMPKMREAAAKKMQLSPAPTTPKNNDDDLINKYLD